MNTPSMVNSTELDPDDEGPWTVGEVAELMDVTVRSLHHWEQIGLLHPQRTEAGHRLYGLEELGLVVHISILRNLGLSLDQIAETLRKDNSGGLIGKLDEVIGSMQREQRALQVKLDSALAVREVLARAESET